MKTIKLNKEVLTYEQKVQISNLLMALDADGLEPMLHNISDTEAVVSHLGNNDERMTMLIFSRNGEMVATEIETVKQ